MYAHPGKKLNFMGNDFAQFREWDEKRCQDWDTLEYPIHQSFHRYIKDLNNLYLTIPAMFESEYDKTCYQWLEVNAPKESVYIFERGKGRNKIIAAFNFSNIDYDDYVIKVKQPIIIKELINSECEIYGGKTPLKPRKIKSIIESIVKIDLSAFTGIIFQILYN